MASPHDVGPLLLLRVHKAPLLLPAPVGPVARDAWFCRWFQLTPPQGAPLRFPCYQWLEGAGSLALRAGAGERVAGEERPAGVAPRDREGPAPCGSRDADRTGGEGRSIWGRRGWGGGPCPPDPLLCSHSQSPLGGRPPHPPATAPRRAEGQAGLVPVRSGPLWRGGWGGVGWRWPPRGGLPWETPTQVPASGPLLRQQHPGAC